VNGNDNGQLQIGIFQSFARKIQIYLEILMSISFCSILFSFYKNSTICHLPRNRQSSLWGPLGNPGICLLFNMFPPGGAPGIAPGGKIPGGIPGGSGIVLCGQIGP
jgi:hypothetical protein